MLRLRATWLGSASRLRLLGLLGLLVLLGPLDSASAAPSEDAAFREQYLRAAKLYAEKDYAAAIPALLAAYAITPAPQLLFNIGQAYRRLEKWSTARVYFEMYSALSSDLSPAARTSLQATLVELREKEEAQRRPEVVEKTRTLVVQAEKPPPRFLLPLSLVTGLSGLGLAVTGGVFLGLDGRCVSPAVAPAQQCEQVYGTKTLGAVLTAAGAGLFIVGGITLALSLRKPARPERPAGVGEAMQETLLVPIMRSDVEPPPQGWNADGTPSGAATGSGPQSSPTSGQRR